MEIEAVKVIEVVEKEASTEITAHQIIQTLLVASSSCTVGRIDDVTAYLLITLAKNRDTEMKLR